MFSGSAGEGLAVEIEGLATPGLIHKDGLLVTGTDGKKVSGLLSFVALLWAVIFKTTNLLYIEHFSGR